MKTRRWIGWTALGAGALSVGLAAATQIGPQATQGPGAGRGDTRGQSARRAALGASSSGVYVLRGDRLYAFDTRTLKLRSSADLPDWSGPPPTANPQPSQPPAPNPQPVNPITKPRTPGLGQLWSDGQALRRGPVRLTHSPMRVEDIGTILPMGLMVGAHVTPSDHAYFFPKDMNAGRFSCDVFAPADGFIVNVQHRVKLEGTTETQRDYDDYRVVIEHTGTFYIYYDLITRLDDAILGKVRGSVPGGPPVRCRIPVKGGQVIGKVGGRSLDIGVVNTEVTLKGLLVPEHYTLEPWKVHSVDPFDYFDQPLKGRLLALNVRKAEPRGGKIDYDVDGRLAGNWFREGTNGYSGAGDPRGYWMGHLAIVYHPIDPTKIILSIGDFAGRPRQFMVKGNQPDPTRVTKDSGIVRYEMVMPDISNSGQRTEGIDPSVQGVLLAKVLAGQKLRIEVFPGKTATEVAAFTPASLYYER